MSTPLPGRPVRGSSTGRPLFALLDLMTRRWTMRVVWELSGRELSFRQLQVACDDMSSSTLSARLGELVEAGLVEHAPGGGYALTRLGADLPDAFTPLVEWSQKWATDRGSGLEEETEQPR